MVIIRRDEFEAAVKDYSRLIFGVCYSFTSDRFISEDLTQETFVAAFRHLDDFRDDNIRGWLTTIAANKCRDYFRSRTYNVSRCSDEIDESIPGGDNIQQRYEEEELHVLLVTVIDGLKEPYRSAARAHYLEDKTAAEYAKEKNINIKTVQTHIARARAKIGARLRKEYGNELQ